MIQLDERGDLTRLAPQSARSVCFLRLSSIVSQFPAVLKAVEWPPEFVSHYSFLAVDQVNGKKCNHFYARPITINGIDYQMDVWTDTAQGKNYVGCSDRLGFPCQVSIQDINAGVTTTWAFDGFNNYIPQGSTAACFIPKIQCAQRVQLVLFGCIDGCRIGNAVPKHPRLPLLWVQPSVGFVETWIADPSTQVTARELLKLIS